MTPFSFGLSVLVWSENKRSYVVVAFEHFLLPFCFFVFYVSQIFNSIQHCSIFFSQTLLEYLSKYIICFQFETYSYKTYKEDVILLLRFPQSSQLRILAPIIIKDNPKLNTIVYDWSSLVRRYIFSYQAMLFSLRGYSNMTSVFGVGR